ncbi:hypothetical protein N9H37_03800, partial [Congregibacter sp.]|nr:hypothetical protein [Congregibacter sp.]
MTVTDITPTRQPKALLGCLLLAASFLMGGAQAQEGEQAPKAEKAPTQHEAEKHEHRTLTPYDAVYKTSTSGLSIKLRRSLSLDENGDCRLTSDGKLLVAGISEVSVFSLEGDLIQPRSYVYQLSGPV